MILPANDRVRGIKNGRSIQTDLFADRARSLRRKDLLKIVRTLYRFSNPSVDDPFERWVIEYHKLKSINFSYPVIRESHLRLQEMLKRRFPAASARTPHELRAMAILRDNTSLEILQSVWIGNGCVDLFLPAVGGKLHKKPRMRGLAIEINGPVHDFEPKMNRDTHKRDVLAELGIGTKSIGNNELRLAQTIDELIEIVSAPRLDSRARRRLWRDIYIVTLIHHGSIEEVSIALAIPPDLIEQLEGHVP